jgi:hypothetical protein
MDHASDTSEPEGDIGGEEEKEEEAKRGTYTSRLSFVIFNYNFCFRRGRTQAKSEGKESGEGEGWVFQ